MKNKYTYYWYVINNGGYRKNVFELRTIYGECNKNLLLPLRVYADNKHFPKNSSFFHNFI
jgi:hypothetical protein